MTFLWILSKQTKQWKRSSLKRPDMGGQIEGINALGWETVLGDCMHEVQLRILRSFGVVYYQELWAGNWMLGGPFLWCMLSLQDVATAKQYKYVICKICIWYIYMLIRTVLQNNQIWPCQANSQMLLVWSGLIRFGSIRLTATGPWTDGERDQPQQLRGRALMG